MNDLNLRDKVAVITGGAGVICSEMGGACLPGKTVIVDLSCSRL
jgi:hypothetical protein